jgi:hypothetical protein
MMKLFVVPTEDLFLNELERNFIGILSKDRVYDNLRTLCWCCIAGDKNKTTRQNLMYALTGNKIPKAKCGINKIVTIIMEKDNK